MDFKINDISVIGAGSMGNSIAFLCAQKEIRTVIIDISESQINIAKNKIDDLLGKLLHKEKISIEESESIKKNLYYSVDYADIKDSQVVIEAVSEKLAIKKDVIEKIERHTKKNTVILSNTSGLSISEIIQNAKRPGKIMCAHFFNPPTVMKLVELIKGEKTTKDTFLKTKKFIEQLGKEPVISPELPGFIVNRLLIPMINEAAFLLLQGAKKTDIDKAMILGANHKMGPLELGDLIGLDIILNIMENLQEGLKNNKYLPCPLIEELVSKGKLGRKTGSGFYDY